MTKLFFTLVVLILLGGGFIYFAGQQASPLDGITGEVPTTPGTGATSTPDTTTLVRVETALGSGASALGVTVTPQGLLEDSRCPIGVQCIWAGQVRVRVQIDSGLGTAHEEFTVGRTITTEAEAVTLVEVSPTPREGVEIAPADYRFIFEIQKRDVNTL
jgi:hypothetical protein